MKHRHIEIMEVCPRDGWQNIPDFIPTERKIEFIRGMLDSGVSTMQIASFVNPKAVPQMRDAKEVTQTIIREYPGRYFNALVPNIVGAKNAIESGLNTVSYVISVSESHNKANIARTHEESFGELSKLQDAYPELEIILACSTVFGCPFAGDVSLDQVLRFVERAVKMNISKVELADTIGVGNPVQVADTFRVVKNEFPHLTLLAHMHDTRNNGIVNSWAAMQSGASIIHTAMGGLGGCPFAPGASGNTSTEDLLYLLERAGYDTGIDFVKYMALLRKMYVEVHGKYSGHQITIKQACTG